MRPPRLAPSDQFVLIRLVLQVDFTKFLPRPPNLIYQQVNWVNYGHETFAKPPLLFYTWKSSGKYGPRIHFFSNKGCFITGPWITLSLSINTCRRHRHRVLLVQRILLFSKEYKNMSWLAPRSDWIVPFHDRASVSWRFYWIGRKHKMRQTWRNGPNP
jgi:hypothetical protein